MTSYTILVTILFIFVLVHISTLVYVLRPKRWIELFRGGEAAVCVAFVIYVARDLLSFHVSDPSYPGVFWGTVNLTLFAIVILFLGGRISQHIRHQMINRQVSRIGIESLRAQGADVSELEKQLQGKKTKK